MDLDAAISALGGKAAPPPPSFDDESLSGAIASLSEPVSKPEAAKPETRPWYAMPKGQTVAEFTAEFKKSATPLEATKFVGSMIAAPGAALAAGYEGIWDVVKGIASGQSWDEAAAVAAKSVEARQKAVQFEPTTEGGQQLASAAASGYNPLNWLPMGAKKAGETQQDMMLRSADQLQKNHPELADKIRGASGALAAVTEGGLNAAPLLLGNVAQARQPMRAGTPAEAAKTTLSEIAPPNVQGLDIPTVIRRRQAAKVAAGKETAPGGPVEAAPARLGARGASTEQVSTTPPPAVDLGLEIPKAGTLRAAVESEPVKGGLPTPVQAERGAVLQRLGINKYWKSAVTGDALEGATNAQTARFDQPAGRAAAAQFASETEALKTATRDLARGGNIESGETAAFARGSKIAAVGDKLRLWFDNTEKAIYETADKKTNGLPAVSVEPVESLLKDRTFKNSVMARDKGHLLTAIEDQLALFKENNPQGITVKNAEQFRQWLNEQWTPETSRILGQVKGAVDKAVTAAAGEDVYGSSRAVHILKKETLENPKGVAQLWDVDPKNPINRAIKVEALPQHIERMSVEQFKNVVDTLRKKVPPELRSDALAAETEIKAHFLKGVLEAGTPNTKTPSPFWQNRRVNDYLKANEEKMSYLFTKPELARLADIRAGGNILAVDASYPGAAAQAANAAKQGLVSRIVGPAVTAAGGGVGTLFGAMVGAPVTGGAAGAALGRAAGERMSGAAAERAALRKVEKRMTTLEEITK